MQCWSGQIKSSTHASWSHQFAGMLWPPQPGLRGCAVQGNTMGKWITPSTWPHRFAQIELLLENLGSPRCFPWSESISRWLIKSKMQLCCEHPSILEGINGGQNCKVLSSVHFFSVQLQKRGFGAKRCLQLAAAWQALWLASTIHTCLHCWSPLWKLKVGSEHYRRIGITKLV